MNLQRTFQLKDFEYELPGELIAQEPPAVRDASRLLFVDRASSKIEDCLFADLPALLKEGDLLIVNDTRVIPARLICRRSTGGIVEILLLRAQADRPSLWLAMASPLRKLRLEERLELVDFPEHFLTVDSIVSAEDGQKRLLVDFGKQEAVYQTLSQAGLAPLPPYIKRQPQAGAEKGSDLERYQTIFAQAPGAVAAPTAGLHFSQETFAGLAKQGVAVKKLTLHVGPGTFKPIASSLADHSIEAERFTICQSTADALNKALAEGRRVIAVGTTSTRALETAGLSGQVAAVEDGQTNLYIRPGFKFKVVSALVTNFHLSGSSLLVLVSTFAGHDLVMRAYRHAITERYRFFSYGDAMLVV